MRILFLNHNIVRRGGTFYRAYHAARYLVRRGHTVTLLTISAGRRWGFRRDVSDGVEIIETPDLLWGVGRSGWDFWDALNRVMFLRGRPWDIVHAWDCRPAVILPALYARGQSRRVKGKLFIDWADWWGRGGTQAERPGKLGKFFYAPVETFFEEAFRTAADGTTVASAALGERARGLGVPAETVMMLPGGSDTVAIYPRDRDAVRAESGMRDRWTVGCMGALTTTDATLLTEALELVRQEIPRLQLLAVGVSIAGSRLPFRKIAHLADDDLVDTGRVAFDRIGGYLAACDVLVLPLWDNLSNRARWPSRLNDYLAAGRPIVATRVGEVQALNERHGFGVVTDPTAQGVAEGLLEMYRDSAAASDHGRRARQLAEGELAWGQVVKRLEAFYMRTEAR
jgi:glycosyltransferase involved in cell wall biosynthesis